MITKNKGFIAGCYIFLGFLVLCCIVPFWLLIASSLTDEAEIVKNGYSLFPAKFSFDAYTYLWNARSGILQAYWMSILVTTIGVAGHVTLTTLYAYPLSRKDLPGRRFFSLYLFFTMLFNGGLVPTYMVYTRIVDVSESIWGLIIPGLLMNAFAVIMMRTYINSNIADEVLEAARIDGANEFQTLFRLILPLSKPIIGTVALMALIAYWNNWTNGMYYINTRRELLGIQNYLTNVMNSSEALQQQAAKGLATGQKVPSISLRMALAVVAVMPVLMMYPFFQKSFVKGITLGSVKG